MDCAPFIAKVAMDTSASNPSSPLMGAIASLATWPTGCFKLQAHACYARGYQKRTAAEQSSHGRQGEA